jgi:peptidoglycan/LPS O-acetylase OafA/YrhL
LTELSRPARAPDVRARPHADRSAIADALRTLAILAVVANHLIEVSKPTLGGHLLHFKVLGIWGVSAFFVLSGFLLSPPYVRAFVGRCERRPSAALFLLRRVLRIVPLYVVAVVVSAIVDLCFHVERVTLKSVVAHLLMLQNFIPKYVQAINGPL